MEKSVFPWETLFIFSFRTSKMLLGYQVYIIFFTGVLLVQAQQCPEIYQRFSDHHTYCLPANTSCTILKTGVTASEKQEILRLHNEYRSKIAMGNENRAGGMPQAADMLELVWDDELAGIAQALTETCRYGHDCSSCRRIRAFSVGQNIGHVTGVGVNLPGWEEFITALYEEVAFFSNRKIDRYVGGPPAGHPQQYGHFTQMVWAKTWRIGCGWSLHREGRATRSYTACNYGPGGNVVGQNVYKRGSPCSQCPSNTCCGSSCRRQGLTSTYQGLCKVVNPSVPPRPIINTADYLVYCDFNDQDDCEASFEGQPWSKYTTRGGNFVGAVLSGGQRSTLHFDATIRSTGTICFEMETRTAANSFTDEPAMNVVSVYDIPDWNDKVTMPTTYGGQTKEERQSFMTHAFSLGVASNMKFSIELSVPAGSAAQYFEIKKFSAKDGACRQ